jgi:hypothetical protein
VETSLSEGMTSPSRDMLWEIPPFGGSHPCISSRIPTRLHDCFDVSGSVSIGSESDRFVNYWGRSSPLRYLTRLRELGVAYRSYTEEYINSTGTSGT